MEPFPGGQGQRQGQGQIQGHGPEFGPGNGPGYIGGQFRGAGDSVMVGRGMLAQIKELMQKVANATQQTASAVQSQNPIPNPYVKEFQEQQADYIELLNKPNKTALDHFYIKRLGLRIKQLTDRLQAEQTAPKPVTMKDPTIQEAIKEAVPQVLQKKRKQKHTSSRSTSYDLCGFFDGEEWKPRVRSPSPGLGAFFEQQQQEEKEQERSSRSRDRHRRTRIPIKKKSPVSHRTRSKRVEEGELVEDSLGCHG